MRTVHAGLRTAAFLSLALLLPACSKQAKEARLLSNAQRYFDAGQYEQAKIEYLNILRLDPRNTSAYLRIGIIFSDDGDKLQALRFLSRARTLSPDNAEVHNALGRTFLALGSAAAARKEALAALKQAPADGKALVLLCSAVQSHEDYESAEQQLKQFPAPTDASYRLASAALSFRNSDRVDGEKAVRLALKLDPQSPEAHVAMAQIYISQKNPSHAEEEFKAAADLSPPRGEARLGYASFEWHIGGADKAASMLADILSRTPDFLSAWYLTAEIAFSAQKPADALAALSHEIQRDPVDINAYLLQSQIWQSEGNTKDAIRSLEGLGEPYSSLPIVQYQLAQVFLQTGATTSAVTLLGKALATSPNYADATLLLAAINLKGGNPQAVIDPMQKLLKADPNSERALILLAKAYETLKQFDQAIGLFRRQIDSHPNDPQSWFLLGMTYSDGGDATDARTAIEKAHELAPLDLSPTIQLVAMDIAAKDFDGALRRAQSQINAQPKSPNAEFLLAKIYAAEHEWPHAEAALLATLKMAPGHVEAAEMLASVYIQQNQTDKAIEELNTLLAKSPANLTARMILAHLYEGGKQIPLAVAAYQQLLALKPDYAPALNNLAYLYSQQPESLAKAVDLAQRAHALLPGDPNVADTLGWILYKNADYRQALALLQESASTPSGGPEVLYHLGMAEYMMDETDVARTALHQAKDSPDDFNGKGEIAPKLDLLDKGGFANASPTDIQAVLDKQPGNLYAEMALGAAWMRQSQWSNAAATFEHALQQNPALTSAAMQLAELYAGPLSNSEKAFEMAEKAHDLAPADASISLLLGRIAFNKGDFLQAYNLIEENIHSAPAGSDSIGLLQDLAWAAYSQGYISEARKVMGEVLTGVSQGSKEAMDAQSFLDLTDPNKNPSATTDSEISTQLAASPDDAPALMLRAQMEIQKGVNQGAIQDLSAVLRRFPDFPKAEQQLAELYLLDPSSQDKAFDLAIKAHASHPNDPDISEVLAQASYQRKDYASTIQLLQDVSGRQPLDTESLFRLGMALWKSRASTSGRVALEEAVNGGLSGHELLEAKSALTALRSE